MPRLSLQNSENRGRLTRSGKRGVASLPAKVCAGEPERMFDGFFFYYISLTDEDDLHHVGCSSAGASLTSSF